MSGIAAGRVAQANLKAPRSYATPVVLGTKPVTYSTNQPRLAPISAKLNFERASLLVARAEAAAAPATASTESAPGLEELNQDTFYPFLEANADKVVVVDFYTDWCGPCKVIYPELVKMAAEMPHIRIVKFNCNKQNKELGVKLAIKVAPTFHVYKGNTKVAEMTGAKVDKLRSLIEQALAN